MTDPLVRIETFYEQLAPHVSVRKSGQMLVEASKEIRRLRKALREISEAAQIIGKAGPLNFPDLETARAKFFKLSAMAEGSISPTVTTSPHAEIA